MLENLLEYYKAGFTLFKICSPEEHRIFTNLRELAKRIKFNLADYSINSGFSIFSGTGNDTSKINPDNPIEAIREIGNHRKTIFLFRNADFYIRIPDIIQYLIDNLYAINRDENTVIFQSYLDNFPEQLKPYLTAIDFQLPNETEIKDTIKAIARQFKNAGNMDDIISKISSKLRGLTKYEIENILSLAFIRTGNQKEREKELVSEILKEKERIIKENSLIELYQSSEGEDFESVGGLDILKEYLKKRQLGFSEKAREFGLPYPKGVLLIGVQGTGKSLVAKATAKEWGVPCIRIDVGRLFGSYVGQSEQNVRNMIKIVENIGQCVAWFDEIEKAFAGLIGNITDSGVTMRVFSTLLTWFQEKTCPAYIIATANDISKLPLEMIRKGRFDEIFFVDLPNKAERKQILEIHLKKYKRDPQKFDTEYYSELLNNFTGSEIAQVVINSLYDAFYENRDITDKDIKVNIIKTKTLYQFNKEKIESLRTWANGRCLFASKRDDVELDKERKLKIEF